VRLVLDDTARRVKMKCAAWLAMMVFVSAAMVLVVSGCGGPQTSSPETQTASPATRERRVEPARAAVPAGAKSVFALDLSKAGKPSLVDQRGVASAKIAGGILEIRTARDDCNFGLFPRKADGIKPPLWLKVEMSNTVAKAFGQVYWSEGGRLSEGNSAKWKMPGDGQMHTYTVEIKAARPVIYLRFDPADHKDTVKIGLLEVLSRG
jgi:hypothetical protein